MLVHVNVKVFPDGRVSRADAAKYLGVAHKTLARWHMQGIGPVCRKVGGRSFYLLADLQAFCASGARQAA